MKQCALISKSAGGIGLSAHNIRAKGTYIKGEGGEDVEGIVVMHYVLSVRAACLPPYICELVYSRYCCA